MGETKNISKSNVSRSSTGRKRSATTQASGRRRKAVSGQNSKTMRNPQKRQLNYTNSFIMLIFFVVVSLYLGQAVYSIATRPEIPSMTIQMGSVDFPVVIDGVIIRDEKVYISPATGVVNYYYSDLERIKKDDTVCVVLKESEYSIQSELNKINTDFLTLQERRGSMSAFDVDVALYNDKIKEYIDSNVFTGINEGISKTYDLKDSLSQNISVRNQMLLSENRGSVQNLYDQKQIFENELNNGTSSIRTSNSGILSYTMDGLESAFNFSTMADLAEGQIKAQGSAVKGANENIVNESDPVFRVIESNEWYIAAYLSLEQIYDWTENSTKIIYIQKGESYTPYEMIVEKINKFNNDAYVLLRSSKYLLDFINARSVKFKINNSEHKGYKIPNTAIIDKTFLKIPIGYLIESDTNYVLKRTFDRDIQVSVTVYSKDEEYCLISHNFNSINPGDRIVKATEDSSEYVISEVETFKGIYIINKGYAEFRKVTLNPDIPEKNPYTILDPSENKSIKIFDRIISDTRNIVEGQKIY